MGLALPLVPASPWFLPGGMWAAGQGGPCWGHRGQPAPKLMAMHGWESDLGGSVPEVLALRAQGDPWVPMGGRAPRHCGGSPEVPQSWQGARPYRGAAQRPGTASPREGRWAPLFTAEPAGQQQLSPLQRGTRAELGTSNPWAGRSGMAGWLPGPPSHRRHGLRRSRGSWQGRARPPPWGTAWHLRGKNWVQGKTELWHCRAGAAGPGMG